MMSGLIGAAKEGNQLKTVDQVASAYVSTVWPKLGNIQKLHIHT